MRGKSLICSRAIYLRPQYSMQIAFTVSLGYVYRGPVRNRSEPNRTGSASVYMELFGTGPGVYTGPFWNRSGSDPILDLQNSRSSFGSVPDQFQNGPV